MRRKSQIAKDQNQWAKWIVEHPRRDTGFGSDHGQSRKDQARLQQLAQHRRARAHPIFQPCIQPPPYRGSAALPWPSLSRRPDSATAEIDNGDIPRSIQRDQTPHIPRFATFLKCTMASASPCTAAFSFSRRRSEACANKRRSWQRWRRRCLIIPSMRACRATSAEKSSRWSARRGTPPVQGERTDVRACSSWVRRSLRLLGGAGKSQRAIIMTKKSRTVQRQGAIHSRPNDAVDKPTPGG